MKKQSTYTVLTIQLLAVMVMSIGFGNAYADHLEVNVSIAPGSDTQGCEETNECYIPHEATVDVGGEVIWTNDGTSSTTITSGTAETGPDGFFDSGLVEPGSSFSFKFEEPGEYHYFSMVHPWMTGLIVVQEAGTEEHEDEEHTGEEMHTEDATATGMLSDGTKVSIMTSAPTSGEKMEITVDFEDSEHANYDVMVTQNGAEVLNDIAAHGHEGEGMHETAPLSSSDPVEVTITFQGFGVDEPKTGPIGEQVVFSNIVPEFGTVAMMILAVSIISIVAVTAKSKVIPRF